MKQVYRTREDGTFDFLDTIVTSGEIPQGYGVPSSNKHYKDDGTELSAEELAQISTSNSQTSIYYLLELDYRLSKIELGLGGL
jgi:hypothetical protein